jgi:mono/diheme cytochrome c family protein
MNRKFSGPGQQPVPVPNTNGRNAMFFATIITLIAFLTSPSASAQTLPDGSGRDVVSRVCSACHTEERITDKRMSGQEWQDTVQRMIRNGAKATPPELEAILTYLNRNFSGKPDGAPVKTQPSSLSLDAARDLSGIWMQAAWYTQLNQGPRGNLPNNAAPRGISTSQTPQALLTSWGRDMVSKYSIYDDPITHCASPGPQAYNAPYAFEFLQTPGRITLLFEYYHEVRRIYIDGREHPKNLSPSAMGHSTGHWEGDTLVIDTAGFEETLPRGGTASAVLPHSEQRHLIERIRRVLDGNVLEIETIDEDPKAFTEPLRSLSYFKKDPSLEIFEHNCEGAIDYSNHAPPSPK